MDAFEEVGSWKTFSDCGTRYEKQLLEIASNTPRARPILIVIGRAMLVCPRHVLQCPAIASVRARAEAASRTSCVAELGTGRVMSSA